jgi:hypothetical protein
MKKFLIGEHWKTSTLGYVMAILQVLHDMSLSGKITFWQVVFATGYVFFGRVMADSKKQTQQ